MMESSERPRPITGQIYLERKRVRLEAQIAGYEQVLEDLEQATGDTRAILEGLRAKKNEIDSQLGTQEQGHAAE